MHIQTWIRGASYHRGDRVRHQGLILVCMTAHKAGDRHQNPWQAADEACRRLSQLWQVDTLALRHEQARCSTGCGIEGCTGLAKERAA